MLSSTQFHLKIVNVFIIIILQYNAVFAQSNLSNFEFTDARSSVAQKAKYISTSIFSCSYFISELTDNGRSIDRVISLKNALENKFGRNLNGHQLRVSSYRIFFNESTKQMDTAVAAGMGSVGVFGSGVNRAVSKCGKEKTPNGWFDIAETNNGNSPMVSEFAAFFDDKLITLRLVHSPSRALSTTAALGVGKAKRNLADEVGSLEFSVLIDKTNAKIIEFISSILADQK